MKRKGNCDGVRAIGLTWIRQQINRDQPMINQKRRFTAETRKEDIAGEFAVVKLDETGFITFWSEEAEQLYGYSLDEMRGKHFASLFCEGELERGRAVYELMAADSRQSYFAFGWQLRKNGQQFWTYSESTRTESGFDILVTETKPNG